ncbi:FimV/HubP family polar landmark protein [Polynucleobacter kasalickyi]|uniref:FimV N-terminal domain-containing protein n=1 Tax=Polynucleobacter kasalickyi TaxID=1938817 RepID=A0A1W1ZDN8_9BURK|nr:FimV/HubP family polar landmark protein [Polynucleobacter kasalickyi]SMC46559.1 FimV N-terminal domain-containing protein [Polynucleobacter kasalickyi]
MTIKPLWFIKSLLLVGLWLSSSVWGLTLGNINVISGLSEPFKARIAILGSNQELSKLSNLKVQFPSQLVFDKYGLKVPDAQNNYLLSIEKSTNGLPVSIFLKTENVIPEQELFNDLLIEVSWTGGKLIRAYTILNVNKMVITVNPGDNLSSITQSLMPELPQASFEQVLTAIFRLNPKAFIAGNIHRLRAGAPLDIPSKAMVESIPVDEASTFTKNVQENFQKKLFTESSEKYFDTSSSTSDRLLLSSSENVTEKKLLETKLEEELIAQKKIIEQAQARVLEIQKNIVDLNKQVEPPSIYSKISSFLHYQSVGMWEFVALVALLIVFIYGNFIRVGTSFSVRPAQSTSSDDIPAFAKNIFATLDLNLDDQGTSTPTNSLNIIAKSEDHGIAINNVKPHRNIPSVADQKLRLNLAKSYIKIHDYPTAKILLQEIVSLGANGSSDVVRDAQKYLLQIA